MAAPHHGQSRTIRENALMQAEALHEIQKRSVLLRDVSGHKGSDEWQRHRERLQQTESPADGSTSNLHPLAPWQ